MNMTVFEYGDDIVVVDNYSNSSPEALKRVKELTGKDFPIYEADVCDSEAMNALFDREKIEAVIHFAGYKAVGESVAHPLMYYRNNYDSALTMLEMCLKYGSALVFSSSATARFFRRFSSTARNLSTSPGLPLRFTRLSLTSSGLFRIVFASSITASSLIRKKARPKRALPLTHISRICV